MNLKILVAGRYNNAQHRAGDYAEGDVLETAPDYGKLLVDAELAEEIEEQPATEESRRPADPAAKKPTKAGKGGRNRPNPFKPES